MHMKKRILIIFTLLMGFYPLNLAADDLFIIANHNVADTVSKYQIREIFMGKKTRWANNEKISFVILKDKNLLGNFLRQFVGKTVSQDTGYWKMQVFNGIGRMPTTFQNETEMIEYVSGNEGAIGFVSSLEQAQNKVKIIHIQN